MTDLLAPPVDLRLPPRVVAPPRLTERHPALLPVAVRVHRVRRRLAWPGGGVVIRPGETFSLPTGGPPGQATS